jgi:NAD(P)-dependent dehydrogenase (short-subunit alcohol dehydrogenase family)
MILAGKKVLVFGGSSSITEKIVLKLKESQASHILFISSEPIGIESSNSFEVVEQNFYDFQIQDNILSKIGEYAWDGVVYAGGKGGVRPVKLNSPEFVSDMFHANVFTFFEWIRILIKKRSLNEAASIVALSSVSSIKGLKSKSVYSASKAALDAAVRGMAAELADRKIRVNSIQKGWVSSDMNLDFIQSNMAINKDNDFERQLLGAIEPDEVANLVTFLLSDQVKTLTGTNLLLDGGYTL